jgi:hypothetical protein
MNYYNKYLKYKNKYLSLKNQLGSGILVKDGEELHFNDEPQFVTVLHNKELNKKVIIFGESHKHPKFKINLKDVSGKEYATFEKDKYNPYTKYIGLISRKINMAKEVNNPFQKVLFLLEEKPYTLQLGGEDKFDPTLFDELPNFVDESLIEEAPNLEYVYGLVLKLMDRYPGKVDIRSIDIRKTLNLDHIVHAFIIRKTQDPEKYTFEKIQEEMDESIANIEKYIINDEPIPPVEIPKDSPPYELPKFLNRNPIRKKYTENKRLSEIFINTTEEYKHLKQFITEQVDIIKSFPKYLIDKTLEREDKIMKTVDLVYPLTNYISRIMDLYGIEYLSEMPNDSTSVYACGLNHAVFIMNNLCINYGYVIEESSDRNANWEYNEEIQSLILKSKYPYKYEDDYDMLNYYMNKTTDKLSKASTDNKIFFYKNLFTGLIQYENPPDIFVKLGGWFTAYQIMNLDFLFTNLFFPLF